jgi:hypothetical protein
MIDYLATAQQPQPENIIPEEVAFALCSGLALSTRHLEEAGYGQLVPYVFRCLEKRPLSDDQPFAFQYLESRRDVDVAGYPAFETAIRLDAEQTREVLRLWGRLRKIRTSGGVNSLWHVAMYCVGR